MKQTRIIDGVGKSAIIAIKNEDQMAGISIAGAYTGQIRIVGMINEEGQEFLIPCYDRQGALISIEDPIPLDFFIDVGGFAYIKVVATSWTSGSITVSSVTSSAKRITTGGGSGGPATDVTVTNFPPGLAQDSTVASILGQIVGTDSLGVALPAAFKHAASQFFYDSNEILEREVRVVGSETFTKTYTNNGSVITNISKWVRS